MTGTASSQDLAEKEFAPHLKESDRNEPQLTGDRVTVIPQIGRIHEPR